MRPHRPARIAAVGMLFLVLSLLGCTGCGVAVYVDAAPRFKWYLTLDRSHALMITNGPVRSLPCILVAQQCTEYNLGRRKFDVTYFAERDTWTLLTIPLPRRRPGGERLQHHLTA